MELVSYNETYNELLHSGIKGMRWGVRRYQNPDGTLTTAGKMRYNKEMAKLRKEEKVLKNREATVAKLNKLEDKKNEIAAKKAELDGNGKAKKSDADDGDSSIKSESTKKHFSFHKEKKVSEMSNDEIQAKIDRMNLEKKYKALVDEIEGKSNNSDSNSKTKSEASKGQKIVEDIVTNSVKNIGTQSVSYLLGVGANKLLEGVANDKQAINPKKGQKDK